MVHRETFMMRLLFLNRYLTCCIARKSQIFHVLERRTHEAETKIVVFQTFAPSNIGSLFQPC